MATIIKYQNPLRTGIPIDESICHSMTLGFDGRLLPDIISYTCASNAVGSANTWPQVLNLLAPGLNDWGTDRTGDVVLMISVSIFDHRNVMIQLDEHILRMGRNLQLAAKFHPTTSTRECSR